MCSPQRPEIGIRFSEVGVLSSYEPLNIGAENQIQSFARTAIVQPKLKTYVYHY